MHDRAPASVVERGGGDGISGGAFSRAAVSVRAGVVATPANRWTSVVSGRPGSDTGRTRCSARARWLLDLGQSH